MNGVVTINAALADVEGHANLFTNSMSSGSLNMSLINSGKNDDSSLTRTMKLSGLITEEVSFLKMDIEGSELMVVNDLIQSGMIQQIKTLIVEYHPKITNVPVGEFINLIAAHKFSGNVREVQLYDNSKDVMIHFERNTFQK